MIVAVAQLRSVNGDIEANIARHQHFVQIASSHQVQLIVFPELSLTQYNPPHAKDVATSVSDPRFEQLQKASDENRISICAGIPLQADGGITISMLIFQPGKPVEIYTKQYLHVDEEPFFVPGVSQRPFSSVSDEIAFAICYELSIPQHAQAANDHGATTYIASVAKTHAGIEKAHERLATVAREYGMTVYLSNCIGPCEGRIGGGQSAIWNSQGHCILKMNDMQEGLIIYDPQSTDHRGEIIAV